MSYSGADDQSEDGELKRSPLVPGNHPEDLDFSLSDEDADTADSLDIKPPQAKLATRTVSRKYDSRSGRESGHSSHHSRSDRHNRESERHSHRDLEKRHRSDKYESSRNQRDYQREKERDYREKEYFLKEGRYVEQLRSSTGRDRREDIRYVTESTREVRHSDSKVPYTDHEKHSRKNRERELKYIEYEQIDDRRKSREQKYYESFEHVETRRIQERRDKRERRDIKNDESINLEEKSAADRALEDLRERLLDKRRTKENQDYKSSSKRHKSKRENISVDSGEIELDSRTYVKEIIDLSKSEDVSNIRRHHKRSEKPKSEDEMSSKELEEREIRRVKLLEAEREMARQKEKSRQEIEARRERRERKRLHEEQKEAAKRRKLEEEEELKLMQLRRAALSNELSGVVTVSDNSEESEVEINESDDESDQRNEDDEDENNSDAQSNHSDESEESEEESSVDSRHRHSQDHGTDNESAHSDDYRANQSDEEEHKSVGHRNRTESRSRSKSVSRSRSRECSHSRSSSVEEENKNNNVGNEEETEIVKKEEVEEPVEELPPYIPATQGCRSVEEFQCLNRIEEGTYGVVYRARDKRTDEIVALKRLKMEKEKEGFPITSLREINTLLKGQHPNIVTVREIVVGSNMDKIFIVMDYVEHDLKSLMETMRNKKTGFVPGEIKCLLQQLLRAVAHLHDNWILHRDLKTSNLLLSHKGILKVGDFGLAREYGSPLKAYTPIVVTLWYRAPELLLCAKEYSTPIDVWSVGCIFGELLLMNALFPGKSEVDQLNRIFKDLGTPNEKIWPGYSKLPAVQKVAFTEYPVSQLRTKFSMLTDQGLNLLSKFLTYDPTQRVTADDALKHPYFSETPLPIDPAMFPTWPAKSELGHRKAMAASPKPPSGGGQYKKLGDGDDDSALGFHMGNTASNLHDARRLAAMGGGFSLKF